VIRRLAPLVRTRVPLAVAAFFAAPIFFASLMCSSLAVDRPRVVGAKEFPSAAGTEAKVWAVALIPPAIMLALGLLALPFRRVGAFVPLAGALALCLLLPVRLDTWVARHTRRFPLGLDYLKDSDPSNTSSRGEWEHAAKDTVLGITHLTLVLVGLGVLIALVVALRRRAAAPAPAAPVPAVHAPDATPPELTKSQL
jgi:hypothetical protein